MSDEKQYRNPLSGGNLRNKICLCGSGKKVKRCHGKDYAIDVIKHNEISRLIDAANKRFKEALEEAANAS